MRKGTKSCMECRRRKIKCTFEPGRTAICNECFARGSTCVDQEHGDISTITQASSVTDSTSLRERVSNLEDLIKEVLHRLPERSTSRRSSPDSDNVETQAAEVLKSLKVPTNARLSLEENILLPGNASEAAPALTLFDNAVLARKQVEPALSREQYNKAKALNAALLQLLPPLSDLEIILESSQEWWTIWREMFPEISDVRCITIKESVSHSLRSEKPGEVGKIMLCIALGVHQLPPYFDWSRLSIKESPEALMDRFVSTVDRLISSDEEIAATIEGIECMVLEAKWQVNMGRPRKAWLLNHKAIAYAQLIGLHRIPNQVPEKADATFTRRLNVWTHLITGDRWLAMMMGLPYTIPESLCTPTLEMAKTQTKGEVTESYILAMCQMIGRMIDRNQNPTAATYSDTLSMDQQLEDIRGRTDASWWTTDRMPDTPTGKHFERLQVQFFHHFVRVCLHQPFMLKSSADKRYQYSHSATLESAREMIKYYDALRGAEDVGPHACKIIDFQAFMAAMLLILNLCGYAQHARGAIPQQPDLDRDQQDSALIDRTIALLHNAATEAGGIVAAHCAQALGTIAKVRMGKCEKNENDSIQISIPYFGRVSITAGKQFVPIKPGTYPDAGISRPTPRAINSNTGLPTPPSMASNSTLPSPRDSLMSASENARPSPYFNSAENIARGIDQPWAGQPDDPFITFDSFMAFPSAGQIDFSNINGNSREGPSTVGSASDLIGQPSQFSGVGSVEEQNMAAGYPFPVVSGNSVDLDHGWDWFGVGAPTM